MHRDLPPRTVCEELKEVAEEFAEKFEKLLEECSIIPPSLADHVLREANHYIRMLNNKI